MEKGDLGVHFEREHGIMRLSPVVLVFRFCRSI